MPSLSKERFRARAVTQPALTPARLPIQTRTVQRIHQTHVSEKQLLSVPPLHSLQTLSKSGRINLRNIGQDYCNWNNLRNIEVNSSHRVSSRNRPLTKSVRSRNSCLPRIWNPWNWSEKIHAVNRSGIVSLQLTLKSVTGSRDRNSWSVSWKICVMASTSITFWQPTERRMCECVKKSTKACTVG